MLEAFRSWGSDCFERLLGPFAIVLWDAPTRTVYAARDGLGERTLFYNLDSRRLVIASEEHVLLAHPEISARLDEGRIAEYFAIRVPADGSTFFADVSELDPAHRVHALLIILGNDMAVTGVASSGQVRGGRPGWHRLEVAAALPVDTRAAVALLVVDGTARVGAPAGSSVFYDDVALTYEGEGSKEDDVTRTELTRDYQATVTLTDSRPLQARGAQFPEDAERSMVRVQQTHPPPLCASPSVGAVDHLRCRRKLLDHVPEVDGQPHRTEGLLVEVTPQQVPHLRCPIG